MKVGKRKKEKGAEKKSELGKTSSEREGKKLSGPPKVNPNVPVRV